MTDRATSYRFTVESLDDPRITDLKAEIAAYNKVVRAEVRSGNSVAKRWKYDGWKNQMSLLRVRIMPRGPRTVASKQDYPQIESGRAYDCYLPQRHGTHFDVYVLEDQPNTRVLQTEIEQGLTPGQQKKLAREEYALVTAQVEMHERLRAAGIHQGMGGKYVSWEKRIEELREAGVPESTIERIA